MISDEGQCVLTKGRFEVRVVVGSLFGWGCVWKVDGGRIQGDIGRF